MNKILCGDVLEVLRTLPDESVQCVVTSPPYWGLRDYGTASWEGGDGGCDHRPDRSIGIDSSTLGGGKKTTNHQQEGYRSICPKCGARRVDSQIGLESTLDEYVAKMVGVFREVRRVLREDGTAWVNMGDTYLAQQGKGFNGQKRLDDANRNVKVKRPDYIKPKDLCGVPWRVAFALQADGWWLRQDIVWHKPNPMPESVTDRCTKAHEYIFLLSKSARYYFDADAIREEAISLDRTQPDPQDKTVSPNGETPWLDNRYARGASGYGVCCLGRNKRSVWTVPSQPFPEAHFATFPEKLIEPCILAGCPVGGVVLDPFMGAGTTAVVCERLERNWIGIELNPGYVKMAEKRIAKSKRERLWDQPSSFLEEIR